MKKPTIAILGAGLAGLGAAWQLAKQGLATVVVLEQSAVVGGNAGSFDLCEIPVDFGSHRLHPACEPGILADIRGLLGQDLLLRPRHGRILLRGRWVHFPLRTLDLLTALPWSFRFGVARDIIRKILPLRANVRADSFADVMEQGLGRTVCREFYFPYAEKIWGIPPPDLSPVQARRRVSASSLGKILLKTLGLNGRGSSGKGRFYYPRGGFGQIAEALAANIVAHGGEIRRGAVIDKIRLGIPNRVDIESGGKKESVEADLVWSTIPIPQLLTLLEPPASAEVLEAGRQLGFRAMVLVYLVLEQPQFTEFDAHYFPGGDVPLTRLSEPKNYSGWNEPSNRTVLCGEIPCEIGDPIWRMSDADLAELMCKALDRCGLPTRKRLIQATSRRLTHAYPLYRRGYEGYLNLVDAWLADREGLATFGRQGLFVHDNAHHALAMAYGAADCVEPSGRFDVERWGNLRSSFEAHVVED